MFEVFRWLAGSILIVSGALKIGRHRELFASLTQLGLPSRLVHTRFVRSVGVRAFPLVEIAVGLGALLVPSRAFPVAVVALFAFFLAIVSRTVLAGREATCDCFGGYGDSAVTRRTIVRNGALTVLGLVGVVTAKAPAIEWGVAFGILAVAVPVIGAAALVFGRPRLQAKRIFAEASNLTLIDAENRAIALTEFTNPPTYLVFLSPHCMSCRSIVERLRWWPHAAPEGFDVQPVFLASPSVVAEVAEYEPLAPYAWYDPDRLVAKAVGVTGTPGVTLIDAKHPIGNGFVHGSTTVEAYVVREGFYEELAAQQEQAAPQE